MLWRFRGQRVAGRIGEVWRVGIGEVGGAGSESAKEIRVPFARVTCGR